MPSAWLTVVFFAGLVTAFPRRSAHRERFRRVKGVKGARLEFLHLVQFAATRNQTPTVIPAHGHQSTIVKAEFQISDMDRHYYQGHNLTIASHPSESDERMMARILAFALHAGEGLEFAGESASGPDGVKRNPG